MRNPGKILQIFKREVTTNQRVYFDLLNAEDRKYMASGNQNGSVSVWDLNAENELADQHEQPVYTSFKAHADCVNGIGLFSNLNYICVHFS
jgi:WD40 repeat protein